MWIFTTVGFFSATQVNRPGRLDLPEGTIQVRARVYEDLEVLRAKYLPALSETIHLPNRDYPYRGYIDKQSLGLAMVDMISDLNYSNFKDEVKKEQGEERAELYMGVWSTMYQAEHKLEDKKAKADAYKARPTFSFERQAVREIEQEVEEASFEKELHTQLLRQEQEREDRISRMAETNSWSLEFDDEGETDPLAAEIANIDHMSFVDSADIDNLFRTRIDDSEDITVADEWAKTWASDDRGKKNRKRKRRRNRR
jgi:hypothetical protein